MKQNHYNRTGDQFPDGDFKTAVKVGPELISYPFEGDGKSFLMHQDFMVYSDYYLDNRPEQGTPHPDYAGLFFIKDSDPQDSSRAALVSFTRTYGILPGFITDNMNSGSSVRIEPESFVWQRPGINTLNTFGGATMIWFVDSASISYPTSTTVTLPTTEKSPIDSTRWSHDLDSNYNRATINAYTTDLQTGIPRDISYTTEIIAKTTTSITVAKVPYYVPGLNGAVLYRWFSRPQVQLNPQQVVVNSFVYYDYWLPGVNCSSIDDIPLPQPFSIEDENGNETDSVTTTSTPPLYTGLTKGYYNMVADGDMILVENPILRRWQGPIFERSRRYIKIV